MAVEEEPKDVEVGHGLLEQPNQPTAPNNLLHSLSAFASIFRPSFFPRRTSRGASGSATMGANGAARARRNASLDGLRGFASFMVYCLHHQLWAHSGPGGKGEKIFEGGWGYDGNYYLVNFHFLRTFFSGGHYAVSVFFVLSGYVLAIKPLRLIRNGDQAGMADTIASSVFRRWPRLFLPILGVTFCLILLWHLFGIRSDFDPEGTLGDEVWRWYAEFKNFSFLWREGGTPWFRYNFPTWSIPVEFRGSIAVYIAILAVSRMSTFARLWTELGLIFYYLYIADGAHFAMFTSGMFLCDFDMLADKDELPMWFNKLPDLSQPALHIMLVISVFLGGVPNYDGDVDKLKETPGWYFLAQLKPQAVFDYKWFFLFWSAVLVVFLAPRIGWLRNFFELRFNQYMGRLCYGFYLIHGPVLWTVGDRLFAAVGFKRDMHESIIPNWIDAFPLPMVGPLGLELSFIICEIVLFPVTLWMAEITTSLFDEPSLRLSGWLYAKCFPASSTTR